MKKFSLAKILSLVVVCVMLLGALALTAFATEGENVDIVSANIYYGDTYQIMFAVDAPEGATVKATDSEGNEINVAPIDAEGTDYKAYILTEGVAAQSIDEVITLSVEYNGKKVSKNYSVLQYIYTRTSILEGKEDATEKELAEIEMLNALLAYAVKANAYFNGATENSFDKYQFVSATGITVNGINPKGMYAPGSTPFANIDAIEYDAEKYELVFTVNGEAKTLDEVKALTVGDTAITVVAELVEKVCEHNYIPAVTNPTCTEAGYTTYTCEGCGDTYTEAGEAATGHSYTDGVCGVCGANDPDYVAEMTIPEALAAELGTKVVVSGTVCEINTPWDANWENISVYITDGENKILCYRMGTDVAKGDIITVTGEIGEYNGAIQIINGTAEITGHDDSYDVAASEVTIAEALELPDGTDIIVTGTIIRIDIAWSSQYNNISVTIKDESGKELYLYRLAGNYDLNDIIKVTGSMSTYGGARQVGAGATAEVVGTHECTDLTEATCTAPAVCKFCGATSGEALEHNIVDGVCTECGFEENASEEITVLDTFEFGANGSASHNDGSEISAGKTYDGENGYQLVITSATKVYGGARDAKGNSALKLGTSKLTGSLTFTVSDDVTQVIIRVAKYKSNTTKVTINGGAAQTITTASNNGEYTDIVIDTTTTKTITFATASGGVRAMIDSITFKG